jgi:diguanylate cyclase (GGDEF)-like protein
LKKLVVIAAIAGVIRFATSTDPALTAVMVGLLAAAAAVYGLWSNGRSHRKGWRLSWGLVTVGLAGNVVGAVLAGAQPLQAWPGTTAILVVTGVGDLVAIAGLVVIIHQQLPGQWAEPLATAVVGTCSLVLPLLSLVVVPTLGWHPERQVLPVTIPALGLVMLWLTMSLLALSERHPVAYRYLVGAFACLFAAQAAGAALYFAGQQSSPVPLNAVLLWGTALWGGAILHTSQRQALEPVPFRSTRPSWSHMALMLVGALVAPVIIGAKALLHIPFSLTLLTAASAAVPVVIVAYLLYQVFARSAAEYRAQHDPLTGVCNRVLFDDRLEAALGDARRSGNPVALMFLDLDRFKSINDSLGHAVGNHLLQAVVKRLQGRLRPKDTLARMGGDEFAILFPEMGGIERTPILAERILGAFSEPFSVGGKLLPVQASIGIALYPGDGEDTETLFKHADTAMYQAKASGRNTYAVYDTSMSAKAELRFALETSLRSSLEQGRLTVHYQPKLSTVDGRVTGVEALARWEHPRLGFIPPSAFIPLAEETSLIANVGEWVLETACLQARAWQQQGLPPLPVAVNVSPRQFVRQSVVRMVANVLARTGLDPKLLELEVTESVLVEHMEDIADSLNELRAMGIRCSIDDFGTGYSALTYLAEMPVDAIKIDPSFVRRIDAENGAAPIVGAVVALAHSLNLQVVAEGVETDSQLEFLTRHGCDHVQGYLFSPPVPEDQIAEFVRDPSRLLSGREWQPGQGGQTDQLLPPARLAAVLAGVNTSGSWASEFDGEDFAAVLGALEPDDVVVISGARGSRVIPARMAVGTLAGLASVPGTLGAAGVIPGAVGVGGDLL